MSENQQGNFNLSGLTLEQLRIIYPSVENFVAFICNMRRSVEAPFTPEMIDLLNQQGEQIFAAQWKTLTAEFIETHCLPSEEE